MPVCPILIVKPKLKRTKVTTLVNIDCEQINTILDR